MRIKKISQIAGLLASVLNVKTESNSDTYSCNYINDLYDALFYKDNEVFNVGNLSCAGLLTTDRTSVHFNIVTDKRLDNINNITINSLKCEIRHADGGYIIGGEELTTIGTLAVIKTSKNILRVKLDLNTKSTFTNNCPVDVRIMSGSIKFNT